MSAVLELKDIQQSYTNSNASICILNQLNFRLHKGQMVALVAPSGVGKSTLLHIAGLLEKPTQGDVIVKGLSCTHSSDKKRTHIRRNMIGFVYQFHHLLAEFTAAENVMMPQLIAGLQWHIARERAFKLLTYLGVGHRANHRPSEMSGGEQQRVAIARAIANAPSILLADEPTGNLDPKTSAHIFDVLASLVKQSGLATLIATHNHSLAKQMDRRVTLQNGQLIELD